ncbi:4'-phosphopantetheinyl transferase superfamily protein [Streptomyces sp. NBC_00536]|uniref:4'-phosphopantetheinyl transferase family protein n=1 Tax=Streptomyces sp. NBC_00536 TaxID=2975769 RepID=UPI002E7FEE0D|nr:4'-phosphopantetheinyl transferase superfamily protein [Streptomyces sp. NBC_00536]WUC80852.1 4'-phosphopantetheinyl transferase superfamily protein [Streptomyces sp. NBC_00536]
MTAKLAPPAGADVWLLRQPKPDDITGVLEMTELDENELQRARACRRQSGGYLYAAAHIALRRVLATYVGEPAGSLEFGRGPCPCCDQQHGRPILLQPTSDLHFSLSHSSGIVLIGVASVPIGVDVEKVPTAETARVCTAALHADERAELAEVPECAGTSAFGRLWTRKEAYLKGLGTGLGRDLSLDYLGWESERHPKGWSVVDVPAGPRHTAAAAIGYDGAPAGPVTLRWLPIESLFTGTRANLANRDSVLAELAA